MLETIIKEPHNPANQCIIMLHGLGASGEDFVDISAQLTFPENSHMRFVFPHAPIRSITINNHFKMPAWYDIKNLENLREEDKAGIVTSQQAINQLIQQQRKQGIAAEKIFLAGFSQGGAMALFTGLRYPEKLGGIIGLSTYLPFVDNIANDIHPNNCQTPVLMAHGSQDTIVPLQLGKHSFIQLKQLGLPVQWHEYPMAHQVCFEELSHLNKWLVNLLAPQQKSLS